MGRNPFREGQKRDSVTLILIGWTFLNQLFQKCCLSKHQVEDLKVADIFGIGVDLYLSPGGGKIAVVRTAHAMVYDNRSYLNILDTNSKGKQRVDKF